MKKSDFYYNLPEALIAQTPIEPRDHSRLMEIDRNTGAIQHGHFYNLCDILRKGDLLVMNDSRVLPARLYGEKMENGTFIEFLLLEQKGDKIWEIIYRAEQSAADKEDALDASIDKIIRQIRRNKTRVEKRLKDTAFKDLAVAAAPDAEPEADNYEVIRHKKFVMHPMSVEEAILQMNLLGHTFFMFTNANTGDMNVVYKRADGKYAVLEPIFD